MIGLKTAEAIVRMGLEPQFYCTADPAGWDLNRMYVDEVVHFLDAVRNQRAVANSISQAIDTLHIAVAARHEGRSAKP